ncbi:MAG: hypothetical protein ACR2JK_16310 [Geodermatophilaceae bacterium]
MCRPDGEGFGVLLTAGVSRDIPTATAAGSDLLADARPTRMQVQT